MRIAIVAGVFALLAAVGVNIWYVVFPESPNIESVALVISEPNYEKGDTDDATKLDIKVHNSGNERGIIAEATVTVDETLTIPACASEGNIPVSGTYDLTLPLKVKSGKEFNIPLNQEVGPDKADRFVIRAQRSESPIPIRWTLYKVTVELKIHGVSELLKVGTALISLPGTPVNTSVPVYWGQDAHMNPDESLSLYDESQREEIVECMHNNSDKLRDFLAQSEHRTDQLVGLRSDLELHPLLLG